jgi:hypothetical protein
VQQLSRQAAQQLMTHVRLSFELTLQLHGLSVGDQQSHAHIIPNLHPSPPLD